MSASRECLEERNVRRYLILVKSFVTWTIQFVLLSTTNPNASVTQDSKVCVFENFKLNLLFYFVFISTHIDVGNQIKKVFFPKCLLWQFIYDVLCLDKKICLF